MTPPLLSSLLAALPLLGHHAAALHVGAPSRRGGRGPEWVDETIRNANGSDWVSRAKDCGGKQLVAMPAQPELQPAAPQGPLTEFSDLSPAEMAWVDEQYSAPAGEKSFLFIPPDAADPAAPPAEGGAGAQELPLTTGECKPAHNGLVPGETELQTCRLQNVYAVDGALVAHVLQSDTFPSDSTPISFNSGMRQSLSTRLSIVKHESKSAFQEYMGNATYSRLGGTTLGFTPVWHFNIGHALYDGLYPAFVSLVQWGMDQDPFRVLKMGGANPLNVENKIPGAYGRSEEVYALIGGKGIVRQHDMGGDQSHSLFETLVIGLGRNSQKVDLSSNFSNGGGRELGAARLLRNHAFKSLDIPARDEQPRLLEGIIINNRRWEKWLGWIEPVRRMAAAAGVKLEFTDWAQAPDQVHTSGGSQVPSPTNSQFRDQLLLISRTYIHISSPGTGMMYQQFLPDGAVHINLGETYGHPRLFMEENMAEGAPYIRALYYWPVTGGRKYFEPDRIMELVMQAKALIEEGFEIPVPVNTNLSPTLRVVKAYAYLTQDVDKLRHLTPLKLMGPSPVGPSYDMNFFGNHYPNEFLQPKFFASLRVPGHVLNPCMLRELTRDYGEPCDNCEWGFP